jgi:signal transduction histidine kinase
MSTDTELLDARVLIGAPIGRDAQLMAAALGAVGARVSVCRDALALVAGVRQGAGVVVVTEECLEGPALPGLAEAVREQPPWSDLPMVILTSADRASESTASVVAQFATLGNVTFLERPVRIMTLISTVQSALRARRRQYEVRDHLQERDRTARELQERAEYTESLNRAKDEFLAMLGHELRNPIGSIMTAVGVLDLADGHDPQVRRATEVIGRQAGHLGHLVDDLLDVSRVTSGRIVLTRRPLDLGEAVTRSVSTLLAARGRRHRVSVTTGPAWMQGDETRIEQIVGNLVVNALKYTPEGGEIDVSVATEAGEAVLRVRDTGIGLPPALLPRIFDLFVQGERGVERAKGGLGIGLTLVRRLVELHGGSVSAASDGPGRGSVFTVRLPMVDAPVTAPVRRGAVATNGARLTILLVEDNADTREMMAQLLRLKGHDVHEAADGVAGVAAALRLRPDVAFVDVGLPGLDGYEVARQIRRAPEGAAVALIALTGYGQPEDRQRAVEAGFDRHVVKPLDPDRLETLLARRG